jgi:hypothetical protein
VAVLQRRVRKDNGSFPAIPPALAEKLTAQYRAHPQWSYQLHADNLAALVENEPALGPCPAYPTVRRFLKAHGLFPRQRRGPVHSPGAQAAEVRFAAREIRSYQSEQVNALWHLDFHHGKVRVLLADGQWGYPLLFGVLDDCSRLCCHLQWYLSEGAEELCHGLSQALLKRALPRALMSDNGSAMLATETTQGLARLGILHETTLPSRRAEGSEYMRSRRAPAHPSLSRCSPASCGPKRRPRACHASHAGTSGTVRACTSRVARGGAGPGSLRNLQRRQDGSPHRRSCRPVPRSGDFQQA